MIPKRSRPSQLSILAVKLMVSHRLLCIALIVTVASLAAHAAPTQEQEQEFPDVPQLFFPLDRVLSDDMILQFEMLLDERATIAVGVVVVDVSALDEERILINIPQTDAGPELIRIAQKRSDVEPYLLPPETRKSLDLPPAPPDDSLSWIGEMEDASGQVNLWREGGRVTGNIRSGEILYEITPTMERQLHMLRYVDLTAYPPDHPPEFEEMSESRDEVAPHDWMTNPGVLELSDELTKIDILVAYTRTVEDKLSSQVPVR